MSYKKIFSVATIIAAVVVLHSCSDQPTNKEERKASKQPSGAELETVKQVTHKFKYTAEFESEAIETFSNLLTGLQVSEIDKNAFLEAFQAMIHDLKDTEQSSDPFVRGTAALQLIAKDAISANRLSEMAAVLIIKSTSAILCQKQGCSWCMTGGWGRLDDLLIGCIPGWKCYYIKMPEGFCNWVD